MTSSDLSTTADLQACRKQERALLRWLWIVFPTFGALAGLLWRHAAWSLISLHRGFLRYEVDWGSAIAAASGGGGALLLLLVWRLLLCRTKHRTLRWPIAFGAVVLCLLVESAWRRPRVQVAFWRAVTARAGNRSDFRETALVRLDHIALRKADHAPPGIVLIGSSQVLFGIDPVALADYTGKPVYRRGMAGMFAVELCAARSYLTVPGTQHYLLYLSYLDVGARQSLNANWMRPHLSKEGYADIYASLDGALRREYWNELADLWLASRSELWRTRDYARFILGHVAGRPDKEYSALPGATTRVLEAQPRRMEALRDDSPFRELALRSLDHMVAGLVAHGTVTIIEGHINPSAEDREIDIFRLEVVDRLRDLARRSGARFIAREELGVEFPPDLWRDVTHLNEMGRKRLTQAIAVRLSEAAVPTDGDYSLPITSDSTRR